MAILTTTHNGLNFTGGTTYIQTGTTTLMSIAVDGSIAFNEYGAGYLKTDASGNITADNTGGGLPGGPYLPLSAGSSYPLTGKLYAQDDIYISGEHVVKNIDTNLYLDSASGYNVLLRPGGSEKVRINSQGQLLINATSSGYSNNDYGYMLGVKGTTSQAIISVARSNQTLDTQGMLFGLNNSEGFVVNRDNSPLRFHTNDLPRMTISASGNVGIGTTSPGAKLHVLGSVILDGHSASDPDSTSRLAYPADQMFTHYDNNGVSIIGGKGSYTGVGLTIGEETGRSSNFKFIRGVSDTNGGVNAAEEFWVNGIGEAYFAGNVGIGTTSPGEKLQVNGRLYIEHQGSDWNETTPGQGIGSIHLDPAGSGVAHTGNAITFGSSDHSNGSVADAGIYTRSDGSYGTKMYFATTDSYAAGSKTRMMIDANGNVGIGTTSPGYKLDISDSSSGAHQIALRSTGSGSAGIWFDASNGDIAGSDYAWIRQNNDLTFELGVDSLGGDMLFTEGGSERMRISNGNVGIGTTSPNAKLHVNTSSTTKFIGTNADYVANSTGSGVLITTGASTGNTYSQIYAFQSGNTAYANLVVPGGNVGIRTTTPTAPLDVYGVRAGRDWAIANRAVIRLDSNGAAEPSDILFGHTAAANQTSWTGAYWSLSSRGSSADNKFYFYRAGGNPTGNAEAIIMTFAPNLNVGIGTTSPTQKLDVNGYARATSGFVGSSGLKLFGDNSSTNFAFVSTSGNVGIGTTSPTEKLDVVGGITASGNNYLNQSNLYNNTTPGITGFGNVSMDTSVSYYDTGKQTPAGTSVRGIVWTGKHYIIIGYGDNKAYFVDNNFDSITNPEASSITLPLVSGVNYPHGGAWDGRYLYCIQYAPGTIVVYDLDNGTTTATIVNTQALSNTTATYDIEYAEGHLYTCADGKVSKYKVEGKTITHVFTSTDILSGIEAQAITYDGSYLWITQNGNSAFKVSLDCVLVATITTGLPPNNTGWAWNGQNVASVNYSTGDIYIVNTAETRFDTEKFSIMGGDVGIGTTTFPTTAIGERELLVQGAIVSKPPGVDDYYSYLKSNWADDGAFELGIQGADVNHKLITTSSYYHGTHLNFHTSDQKRMVIDAGGNVGIGTTSPTAAKLVVDSNTAPQILVKNSGGGNAQILFEDNSGGTQNASITYDQSGDNALSIATEYDSPNDLNKIKLVPGGEVAMTLSGGDDSTGTNGIITFNGYVGTRQTGTPTYILGTDASGNVVKTQQVPGVSAAASLYELIPNGAFTTTYSFTSVAGVYSEVMEGNDVITSSGTYSVQIYVHDHAAGGTQYHEYYSGVMSWFATGTNDAGGGAVSEIALHRAGHAGNQGMIYLRTRETTNAETNKLKLEIMCNRTYTSASNVVFKFVRLI